MGAAIGGIPGMGLVRVVRPGASLAEDRRRALRDRRGGVEPADLFDFAAQVANVKTLKLEGLMAVASLSVDPEPDFETVASLSQKLVCDHPKADKLSIGMSGDYLLALSYGATHLRIGTAITGNRNI